MANVALNLRTLEIAAAISKARKYSYGEGIFIGIKELNEIDWIKESEKEYPKELNGGFTLNLENINLDFDNLQPVVFDLKESFPESGSLAVIASKIISDYSKDFYIPGFEFHAYLLKKLKDSNNQSLPNFLNEFIDSNYIFTPGSLILCKSRCRMPFISLSKHHNKINLSENNFWGQHISGSYGHMFSSKIILFKK